MNIQEFSDEFDVLLNSNASIPKFGSIEDDNSIVVDEYEKSVFLTIAQESIILEYYNGENPFGKSFEETEDVRKYLKNLINTYIVQDFNYSNDTDYIGLTNTSLVSELPKDLWFITYEAVFLKDSKLPCGSKEALVIPVTQDTFYKINRNPFRGSSSNRVLRLDTNNGVELVSKYKIEKYLVRYIARPKPIILTELPHPLKINGIKEKTECEMHTALHKDILERAVNMVIQKKAKK